MSAKRTVLEKGRTLGIAALALAAMATLGGCAAIVIGATVGAGTLVAMDRRSASVIQSDQAVEQKVGKAVSDRWPPASGVHVNVTSYSGKVLLTGEVPTAAIRGQIEKIASSTQYVQAVTNEILVGPESTVYVLDTPKDQFLDEMSHAVAGFDSTLRYPYCVRAKDHPPRSAVRPAHAERCRGGKTR